MTESVDIRRRLPEHSRTVRAVQLLTAAALILLALSMFGCGSDDDDEATNEGSGGAEEALAPNIVTDSDIQAQEEGSPGRALLEWWQSYQFQDAAAVEALTSPEALDKIGAGKLEELVSTRGASLQGIEVLDATESGDTASVRAGLLTFTPEKEGDPPPSEPTSSVPATFSMAQDGGDWLFDDPEYLEPQLESLAAAQEEAAGDEGEGG